MDTSNHGRQSASSLNQWLALTPSELVGSNLHVGPDLLDKLRKVKWPVVTYPGFAYDPDKPDFK